MSSTYCALNIVVILMDQDHYISEELSEKQKPWLEDPNEGNQALHASVVSPPPGFVKRDL